MARKETIGVKSRRLQFVLVLIGIGWLALTLYLIPWTSISSTDEIVGEVPSPDGRLKVVTFVRRPWLQTDFSTHVSLMGVRQATDRDAGRILEAWPTGDHDMGSHGELKVGVLWKANRELVLSYDERAEVDFAVCSIGGIRILHERTR
jgi:hypothetical protein